MRYINPDDAVKILTNRYRELRGTYGDLGGAVMGAARLVEAVPTVELKPIEGYWYGEADGYSDGELVYDEWFCSECGTHFNEWDDKPTWKYCPNCGAKMVNIDG